MSVEENKAIARRFFEEVWNNGNVDAIDELVAPNYVDHSAPPDLSPDREGLKQLVGMYLAAFPDIDILIEDQIAEGDLVTTRWMAHGAHQGELMGIPATGKTCGKKSSSSLTFE